VYLSDDKAVVQDRLVNFFEIPLPNIGIILEKEAYAIFCKLKPFLLLNIHDILKIAYSLQHGTASDNMAANSKKALLGNPCILLNHQYRLSVTI